MSGYKVFGSGVEKAQCAVDSKFVLRVSCRNILALHSAA